MDISEAEDTIDRRGERFVRLAWTRIAALAVVLAVGLLAVRLSGDAIRARRQLALLADTAEQRLAAAEERLADRGDLEAEVEALRARRSDGAAALLAGEAQVSLPPLVRGVCERAGVTLEELDLGPPHPLGALGSRTALISFTGDRQQVPVLVQELFDRPELLVLTDLELEMVNFVDDRVIGTASVEVPTLRSSPDATGEILRPYLPPLLPVGSDGLLAGPGHARERLDAAVAGLERIHPELLAYERLTAERDHYRAESRAIAALVDDRPRLQADVARALPRLDRALTRSALGRSGLHVEPGGAVELRLED